VRLEAYALDVDFPGWPAGGRGAKSMSARSFVARQRDHRHDRGKSVSNAVVNDMSETEPDTKNTLDESVWVSPRMFSFPGE